MIITAHTETDRQALSAAMLLSFVIGFLMLIMKTGAYLLTGSAAILSDAAESVVHIAAVGFAAYSLRLSFKPADSSHLYGHAKVAFFSAGFEGAMIILAAFYIIYESIHKWMIGLRLEHVGLGTALTAAAAIINGGLGSYLLWVGRRRHSVVLQANGKHVLTDCWTSAAVLVGLGLVLLTGWLPFDPLCGILMACNILVTGGLLIRSSISGLMDRADPSVNKLLQDLLDRECATHSIHYHYLRHRHLGDAYWVETHLLFPEGTLLVDAHRIATAVEEAVKRALLPRAFVTTHLECVSDHDDLHPDEPPARPG